MTLIAFAINSTKYLNLKNSLGTAIAPIAYTVWTTCDRESATYKGFVIASQGLIIFVISYPNILYLFLFFSFNFVSDEELQGRKPNSCYPKPTKFVRLGY